MIFLFYIYISVFLTSTSVLGFFFSSQTDSEGRMGMRSALFSPSDDGDANRSPLSYSSRGLYSRKPSTLLTGSSQSSNGQSSGRGTSYQMGGFQWACRSSPGRATHALNLSHNQWPEFKSDLGHLQHGTPTFLLLFPCLIIRISGSFKINLDRIFAIIVQPRVEVLKKTLRLFCCS